MPARTPAEICQLFKQYMAAGNLDALLSLYDDEAVFLTEDREITNGKSQLRSQLKPLATAKTHFEFTIQQIIQSRDTALMHTLWKVSTPQPRSVYAIEVARLQPDGSWRWLIGDPFTVGRVTSQSKVA